MIETRLALPVRSPTPFIVPWTCVAPARDRGERVRHAALGVVVAVDRDARAVADGGDDGRGRQRDLVGQRRAVGVAEGDRVGARVDRGRQAGPGVALVVAPGVEEVLGVVDDALAGGGQEGDGLADHRQVLLARDAHDLLEVQAPGLADDRRDGREGRGERLQALVLGGGGVAAPGHPEGGDLRAREGLLGQQLEELELLGVRRREAGLDHPDAEGVERAGDADLLGGREVDPRSLHPIAQGRVVELDHAGCSAGTGTGSSHSR